MTTGEPASGGPNLQMADAIFFLGHREVELTAEHASGELRRRLLVRLDAMRAGCDEVPLDEE